MLNRAGKTYTCKYLHTYLYTWYHLDLCVLGKSSGSAWMNSDLLLCVFALLLIAEEGVARIRAPGLVL